MQKPGSDLVVGGWASEPVDQKMQMTSGTADPEQWFVDTFGGHSYSGIQVTEGTVLTSGPVYQAINLISSDLASLPIAVLDEETDGNKVKVPQHPVSQIFNYEGNKEMLPYAVRQYLIAQALLYGNGIGAIHFEMGIPTGVYPMASRNVWLDRLEQRGDVPGNPTGELVYRYATPSGEGYLFPYEVFHFKIIGTGRWGYSPLGLFANTFGNGMATEKYQGKHFANDARPSGVLQHPGVMKPDARANVRREWEGVHQGLDNTSKIAVLWQGMTWAPMSVSNKDSEMLDTRKFYREEIAAIYNIPPHKLGAMENSAVRANIEEQNRDYVQHTLSPHDRSFAQECRQKLTTLKERNAQTLTIKHNFKALLRGDLKSRYDSFSIGRQWGWLSANDVLRIEDMDEIGEQGDIYMVPSNMANAETGEPFTGSAPEESAEAVDEETESLKVFAKSSMMSAQTIEINALRRAITSKSKPFTEFSEKYYSTFATFLVGPLKALAHVETFADASQIQAAVEAYAAESLAAVQDVTDENELMDVVLQWPARIDLAIDSITGEQS